MSTRKAILVSGIAGGIVLAVLWSATLVDESIGFNVTNAVLGGHASVRPLSAAGSGVLFAFVSGLAGSFTACNVAGLCAVAPLSGARHARVETWKVLGWLALAACATAGLYGALGSLIGSHIPQLSTAFAGRWPVRIIQSSVVFGLIGIAFVWLALAALEIVPDPLARARQKHPRAPIVVIGCLIGAFLIGRPYPLFYKLFKYAADTHDPAYGALLFMLQTLGNVAIMSLVFVALNALDGGAFQRWLRARPGRSTAVTAGALLIAGTFLIAYWVVRVPAHFGIGWWPQMPWS
jgi:hypothetical protein